MLTLITVSCVRFADCMPLLTKWKLCRCRVKWWLPGSGVRRRIGWCWSIVTNFVLFDWGKDWTQVSALSGYLGGPFNMNTGTGFWFFYSSIPLFLSLSASLCTDDFLWLYALISFFLFFVSLIQVFALC